jgi:DNA-binding NarL/FixJ family response regulator
MSFPIRLPSYPGPLYLSANRAVKYEGIEPTIHPPKPEETSDAQPAKPARRGGRPLSDSYYGPIFAYLEMGMEVKIIADKLNISKATIFKIAKTL